MKLLGFDTSPTQFPPPSKLPPNVALQTHRILDSFQQQLQGTFDVVHVRLVGQVFHTTDQRSTAIDNVISLLKVGGWVQWTEPDHLVQAEVVT